MDNIVAPRGFHGAAILGTLLYIFGGSANFDPVLNECKTYRDDLSCIDLGTVVDVQFVQPPPPEPAPTDAPVANTPVIA